MLRKKAKLAAAAPRNFLEQLAELSNTAPEDIDPEAVGYEGTINLEPSYEEDNEVEVQPSKLRSKASTLMDDPAYSGKVASRKQMGYIASGLVSFTPIITDRVRAGIG